MNSSTELKSEVFSIYPLFVCSIGYFKDVSTTVVIQKIKLKLTLIVLHLVKCVTKLCRNFKTCQRINLEFPNFMKFCGLRIRCAKKKSEKSPTLRVWGGTGGFPAVPSGIPARPASVISLDPKSARPAAVVARRQSQGHAQSQPRPHWHHSSPVRQNHQNQHRKKFNFRQLVLSGIERLRRYAQQGYSQT